MRLDRWGKCPLGRDLEPGCVNCQKCNYFVDKNSDYMTECKLEDLTEKIKWRLDDHCLREPVGVLAKRILQLIVAQGVLEEH